VWKRTKEVLRNQLRQGLTVRQASLAVAIGLLGGIFPILGCSSVATIGLAASLRLNQPIALAFNFIAFPVKVLMIVPFLRFGEWLFRAEPLPFDIVAFTAEWMAAPMATTQSFAMSFVHVLGGWVVAAPFLLGLVYLLALPPIRRVAMVVAARTA